MPVAHSGVDAEGMAGRGEGGLKGAGLGEGPTGERRRLGAGGVAEADLGIAVLKFFHNFTREGAAAGDLGEVFGHLAEGVGGSMGEEKDGCLVGLGHGFVHPIPIPAPLGIYTRFDDAKGVASTYIRRCIYFCGCSAWGSAGFRSGPDGRLGHDAGTALFPSLIIRVVSRGWTSSHRDEAAMNGDPAKCNYGDSELRSE
jgi:hypothetical protein